MSKRPSFEERCRITDAQQPHREQQFAAYRYTGSGRQNESPTLLFPCPVCGEDWAKADPNHAICRRCEGYAE